MDYQSFQPNPPAPQIPQQMLPAQKNFTPKFVGVVVGLLVLGGVASAGLWFWNDKNVETVVPTFMPRDVMADWQTYRNEWAGFEFKYPSDWKITLLSKEHGNTETLSFEKANSPFLGEDYYIYLTLADSVSIKAGREYCEIDNKEEGMGCISYEPLPCLSNSDSCYVYKRLVPHNYTQKIYEFKNSREQVISFSATFMNANQVFGQKGILNITDKEFIEANKGKAEYILILNTFNQILSTFKFTK